ncbi:GIR2 (YDR152W) [Zygosaccharomyces parabailii]|nr:GIR2 (YDR152W) [Zygosaccharomyces parabailii]CDH16308.1 related to Protein GIR2 [Zygosaccharomyces bailii ISA1307]SJM87890.1 related to protein GIR2 [Zygosaccharomyces bailii]
MDYEEEQNQELEVLESIYPDELEVIKRKYPEIHFLVSLKLELPLDDPSLLTNEYHIEVDFHLPANYPEEAPQIGLRPIETPLVDEIESEAQEEEQEYDDHGNKIVSRLHDNANSIHFDSYMPELQVQIEEHIQDDMLLGMQMCFALLASIKDHCETWFAEQFEKLEKEHERELQEREKEEQRKFLGTPVTPKSFLTWRTKFREENKIDERDANRRALMHHGRLTGRQIFEQGLAGDEEEEEPAEEVAQLSTKLKKSL